MDVLQDIRRSRMTRFQVVAATVALVMILLDGFDVAAMAYAAPSLSAAWGTESVMLGYLLSASLFGMAAGSIFIPPIADVIGRRWLAVGSMFVIAVGMGLSALATDEIMLLVFRLLTGLGVGGMMANLNVFVSEYASDARRGSIIGIYAAGYPIGATIGGVVAEPLITAFGWQALFLAGGVLSALMFIIALLFLPESLDFLFARQPKGALGKANRLLFGALAGAAGAYVLFGVVFSVIPVAMGIAVLLGFLTTAGIAGFYAVAPGVYTARARATGIGWMIGIGRLVSIVAPILVGYLIDGGWDPETIFYLFAVPLLASAACVAALSMSLRRQGAALPLAPTASA